MWPLLQPSCFPPTHPVVCADFNDSLGNFVITNNISEALTPGTIVTVLCTEGSGPVEGVNVSTCDDDGNWSPSPPGCHCKFNNANI